MSYAYVYFIKCLLDDFSNRQGVIMVSGQGGSVFSLPPSISAFSRAYFRPPQKLKRTHAMYTEEHLEWFRAAEDPLTRTAV